jgi:NADH:ubiquinone oxidoreductase subunit 5 (subunit L)/multisubunit Na+/H+ antiporter MnhA subunit
MAPIIAFVLTISGANTRRASAGVTTLGAMVQFLAAALVVWGLAKKTAPFLASYPYMTVSVAFNGPVNFQVFQVDLVLRADHLTPIALLVIDACAIAALGWHRLMGRAEPGQVRFHALISIFLVGCAGIVVSNDLVELWAFWALTGAVTYLLLAQRWGANEPARRARVALALPFLSDLFLLCGIAVLYSRYGAQKLDTLVPILHTAAGWNVRQLVVASVLLFVGVAGRMALWPVQSWVTRTALTAPPAAVAIAQASWSVLAIVVLYRFMPIIAASSTQTMRDFVYACGVAAIVGPALSLLSNEPRRAITLLGTGVTAVGAAVVIRGFENSGFTYAIAGVMCVLAAAPARTAALLAVSGIARAMRTNDMREMGDAWRRMRRSSMLLLLSSLLLSLSATAALAFGIDSRSRLGLALGEGMLLVSIGSLRILLGIALAPLRRRRAFEPDRVREAPAASLNWPYWLVLGGVVLTVAPFINGWLGFLDGLKHMTPGTGAYLLWVVVAVVGFAAAAVAHVPNKDAALQAAARLGELVDRITTAGVALVGRFIVGPGVDIAGRTAEWIPAGDGAIGRSAVAAGWVPILMARVPAAALLVLLAVVLAVVVGLVTPGVFR